MKKSRMHFKVDTVDANGNHEKQLKTTSRARALIEAKIWMSLGVSVFIESKLKRKKK